jgi:outer membrane protein assembly factor BamB
MQKRTLIIAALITILGSCNRSGPQSGGSASRVDLPEPQLLDEWPREGPRLLWKYEGLGRGYGGPAVTGEGIYINAEENGNSYTVCLDHDGTLRWRSPNGQEFVGFDFSASYPGTRSAPAVKGMLVYAASGTGHLSCFDSCNGDVIWNVDLIRDFDGKLGDFGYSETPVVDAAKVYCFAAGKEHNLVALDRRTGDLVWSSPVLRDSFAYGTPVLLALPDRNILVGTSRNYIHVVDTKDGAMLSRYRLEDITYGNEHCNSVVHQEGHIYFVPFEEDGHGTVKLRLSGNGENLTEVWRNPQVTNVFEGFVVCDKRLYTTMENKKLLSLDTETGRIVHSVRSEYGNIVYADHKLFIYSHNGKVQLFNLIDGVPEFSSEMRIRDGSGPHFSFPVIAGGVMYIRRGNALMAFAVG